MLSIVRLLVVLLVASSGLHASRAAPKTPVREIPRNGGQLPPLARSAAGASRALPLPAGANRTTSLNGYWNFVTDPSGNLKVGDLASASNIRKALVPGSWQSQFDDLRDYDRITRTDERRGPFREEEWFRRKLDALLYSVVSV